MSVHDEMRRQRFAFAEGDLDFALGDGGRGHVHDELRACWHRRAASNGIRGKSPFVAAVRRHEHAAPMRVGEGEADQSGFGCHLHEFAHTSQMPGAFQRNDACAIPLRLGNAEIHGVPADDLAETEIAIQREDARLLAHHGEAAYWLDQAAAAVAERLRDLERPMPRSEIVERAERLAALADDLVEETEFDFLFDEERRLFSIGFNVAEGRLDASYYDTLASEARLASFLAIATGKIGHEHWFRLGRSLTPAGGARALLSWSASMFEYLMPLLVMRTYPGTLLHETYGAVVQRQIQ